MRESLEKALLFREFFPCFSADVVDGSAATLLMSMHLLVLLMPVLMMLLDFVLRLLMVLLLLLMV